MTIISIGLKNFYSFKEEVKMNFLVNENAPKTSHFGLCNEGDRFSKVSSVFSEGINRNIFSRMEYIKVKIKHSSFLYLLNQEGLNTYTIC